MRNTLPLALALSACGPNYDTITDACPAHIGGETLSEDDAIAVFSRMSCYRRFAKTTEASIDHRISDAARSHALYLEDNGYEEGGGFIETAGNPSFTGRDPFDRIEAQGYDWGPAEPYVGVGLWEGFFLNDPSFDPVAIADGWMWGQYERQAVLQPAWMDGGYGATDDFAVITILYSFPAPEASARPITWPRDGQRAVPTTWAYGYDDGAVELFSEVGYPITFTVGSNEDDSVFGDTNPYEMFVSSAVITGPDGEVDYHLVTPDTAIYNFPYTVALIPEVPLAEHSNYTATVRLRWNSHPGTHEFSTTFTTGAAPAATARELPRPVRVLSKPPGGPVTIWTP